MGVYDVVFFVLAALTVLSACVVAGSRNIVYSGFALIFTPCLRRMGSMSLSSGA